MNQIEYLKGNPEVIRRPGSSEANVE